MREVENKMCEFLEHNSTSYDKRNNRHIIQFLKIKFPLFDDFMSCEIIKDFKNSREDFFEMISILRNVVAHHAMIVTDDTRNSICSRAKFVFEHFFDLEKDEDQNLVLSPKLGKEENEPSIFRHLIDLINRFTLNSTQLIMGEGDLNFLGLK